MSRFSVAGLSWHTPDGDPLFTNLTLSFGRQRTGLVGRNGTGKTTLMRLLAGTLTPDAGAIQRPPSIGVLHQNPAMIPGLDLAATIGDLFGVTDQLALLERADRGVATAEDLARADWTLEARLQAALHRLGLHHAPETPLATLSGGQRTRANLAALMFADHDALLLDEPTNHLDQEGRQHVVRALRDWQGCAVVASHDRTLLGEMDAIVELTSLGAESYGGNYSFYRSTKDAVLRAARQNLQQAAHRVREVQTQAQRATERKARTDRQGKQLRVSGSQSKLLLDAAKERSEGSASSAARLHARQAAAATADLQAAKEAIEVLEPLQMEIPTCDLPPTREVLRIEDLQFGYQTSQPLFSNLSFALHGPARAAIEGANGAGKSTLLACIEGQLKPQKGVVNLSVPHALIDQDLSLLHPDETVVEAIARLDPDATDNHRRAMLARFLFRGNAAERRIGTLSGGQRMRAALACTLGHSQPRQLLLLDEPSNHLDIEAVETLEAALNGYNGALLVVSHDPAFLQRIGIERRIAI